MKTIWNKALYDAHKIYQTATWSDDVCEKVVNENNGWEYLKEG